MGGCLVSNWSEGGNVYCQNWGGGEAVAVTHVVNKVCLCLGGVGEGERRC